MMILQFSTIKAYGNIFNECQVKYSLTDVPALAQKTLLVTLQPLATQIYSKSKAQ